MFVLLPVWRDTPLQYRFVGDTGVSVSALGFGTMRFKSRENAAQIIRHGLKLGLTYFDIGSAYSYKAFDDNAETWTGAAIAGVPREQMVLSAKAQPRYGEARVEMGLGISTRDDMWRCIENSLQRVGVSWLDFYQLWDMSADDHFAAGCGHADSPLQAMREARDQGLVKHLGFTTHGKADDIIKWLQAVPDFRFITIYYNFNDRALERVVDFAYEHGVGIAVMGPLRGGLLTGNSAAFARLLPELDGMPVQEVALRYLLASPAVSTILSGMNEIAHLEQNARVASEEALLSDDQRQRFAEAFWQATGGEPLCTACNYCAGVCPQGLPVAHAMSLYQLHAIFGVEGAGAMIAAARGQEDSDPARCTACGACVEACPQGLPVPERMQRLATIMQQMG